MAATLHKHKDLMTLLMIKNFSFFFPSKLQMISYMQKYIITFPNQDKLEKLAWRNERPNEPKEVN